MMDWRANRCRVCGHCERGARRAARTPRSKQSPTMRQMQWSLTMRAVHGRKFSQEKHETRPAKTKVA